MGTVHLFDRAISFIVDTLATDYYRLGTVAVDGTTVVTFSTPLIYANYEVTILSYTVNTTLIDYGWTISNLLAGSFTFTPPVEYSVGTLVYEVKLYK